MGWVKIRWWEEWNWYGVKWYAWKSVYQSFHVPTNHHKIPFPDVYVSIYGKTNKQGWQIELLQTTKNPPVNTRILQNRASLIWEPFISFPPKAPRIGLGGAFSAFPQPSWLEINSSNCSSALFRRCHQLLTAGNVAFQRVSSKEGFPIYAKIFWDWSSFHLFLKPTSLLTRTSAAAAATPPFYFSHRRLFLCVGFPSIPSLSHTFPHTSQAAGEGHNGRAGEAGGLHHTSHMQVKSRSQRREMMGSMLKGVSESRNSKLLKGNFLFPDSNWTPG